MKSHLGPKNLLGFFWFILAILDLDPPSFLTRNVPENQEINSFTLKTFSAKRTMKEAALT